MKYYTLMFVVLAVLMSEARHVKFKDCGTEGTQVLYTSVSPCPSEPCPLVHMSDVQISIKFKPTVSKKRLTAYLSAIAEGIHDPYPLPDPDACRAGVRCPLVPGRAEMYNQTINIDPVLPDLNVTVQWELLDDNYEDFLCVQFPGYIT